MVRGESSQWLHTHVNLNITSPYKEHLRLPAVHDGNNSTRCRRLCGSLGSIWYSTHGYNSESLSLSHGWPGILLTFFVFLHFSVLSSAATIIKNHQLRVKSRFAIQNCMKRIRWPVEVSSKLLVVSANGPLVIKLIEMVKGLLWMLFSQNQSLVSHCKSQ